MIAWRRCGRPLADADEEEKREETADKDMVEGKAIVDLSAGGVWDRQRIREAVRTALRSAPGARTGKESTKKQRTHSRETGSMLPNLR